MITKHTDLTPKPEPVPPTTIQPVRIVDVAGPGGRGPADATARPVIVSNRVIMQDPMMAPLSGATASAAAPTATSSGAAVASTVQPATVSSGAQRGAAEDIADSRSPLAAESPANVQPVAIGESAPGENGTMVDQETARLEADAKIQDELDTLVDQKAYFLPINSVEQRRSRHVFIFGSIVIVLLALAWLDIALDAGFVTIAHLQPVTHLFRD